MTLFYQTNSWTSQPQISDETLNLWKHVAEKKHCFYQTEYLDPNKKDSWIDATRRETIEGAEQAIDSSIEHYKKKLAHLHGPQVVKTFK
jgi:hypothetical protein